MMNGRDVLLQSFVYIQTTSLKHSEEPILILL